jgi:hypothetical protein
VKKKTFLLESENLCNKWVGDYGDYGDYIPQISYMFIPLKVSGKIQNREYALCVVKKKVGAIYLDVMRQKAGGMI